jgi:hypothetical protein
VPHETPVLPATLLALTGVAQFLLATAPPNQSRAGFTVIALTELKLNYVPLQVK